MMKMNSIAIYFLKGELMILLLYIILKIVNMSIPSGPFGICAAQILSSKAIQDGLSDWHNFTSNNDSVSSTKVLRERNSQVLYTFNIKYNEKYTCFYINRLLIGCTLSNVIKYVMSSISVSSGIVAMLIDNNSYIGNRNLLGMQIKYRIVLNTNEMIMRGIFARDVANKLMYGKSFSNILILIYPSSYGILDIILHGEQFNYDGNLMIKGYNNIDYIDYNLPNASINTQSIYPILYKMVQNNIISDIDINMPSEVYKYFGIESAKLCMRKIIANKYPDNKELQEKLPCMLTVDGYVSKIGKPSIEKGSILTKIGLEKISYEINKILYEDSDDYLIRPHSRLIAGSKCNIGTKGLFDVVNI